MFKKMKKGKYPPRRWALVGFPGTGKSTFATQMKVPMVIIDADQRFEEVMHLASSDDIYQVNDAQNNSDIDAIIASLEKGMPGLGVKTIVVDSLTAIITPILGRTIRNNDNGVNTNKLGAFREKAVAMRTLQYAVSRWGSDTLWIYHLQRSSKLLNGEVVKVEVTTLPKAERERLTSSLNMELRTIKDKGRYGINIVWSRTGITGVLWDDNGQWVGMPEKIEEFVYNSNNRVFSSPEKAIEWAIERGAFSDSEAAWGAYNDVKKQKNPTSASQMGSYWIDYVNENKNNG